MQRRAWARGARACRDPMQLGIGDLLHRIDERLAGGGRVLAAAAASPGFWLRLARASCETSLVMRTSIAGTWLLIACILSVDRGARVEARSVVVAIEQRVTQDIQRREGEIEADLHRGGDVTSDCAERCGLGLRDLLRGCGGLRLKILGQRLGAKQGILDRLGSADLGSAAALVLPQMRARFL